MYRHYVTLQELVHIVDIGTGYGLHVRGKVVNIVRYELCKGGVYFWDSTGQRYAHTGRYWWDKLHVWYWNEEP